MILEDLKVYNLSMKLAEDIWAIIIRWDYFTKDTIGKQLMKSVDSISANLSEGYGRYHFIKDSKNFSYYSRGSLYETKTWLIKAFKRDLITRPQFDALLSDIETIGKMLNAYIKSTGDVYRQTTKNTN